LWVFCFVRLSSLRLADHSPRGVLPNVVGCMIVKFRSAGTLGIVAPLGSIVSCTIPHCVMYHSPFHQNLPSAAHSENWKSFDASIWFSACWHVRLFCNHSSIVDNKRIS
jgi:hypothetical protein